MPSTRAGSQRQVKAWWKLRTRQLQSSVWGRRTDRSGAEFSPATYSVPRASCFTYPSSTFLAW